MGLDLDVGDHESHHGLRGHRVGRPRAGSRDLQVGLCCRSRGHVKCGPSWVNETPSVASVETKYI